MKRRRFLASTLALASLPRIALGQSPSKVFRVGWLIGGSADGSALFLDALRAGLADHGYVEGRNVAELQSRIGAGNRAERPGRATIGTAQHRGAMAAHPHDSLARRADGLQQGCRPADLCVE